MTISNFIFITKLYTVVKISDILPNLIYKIIIWWISLREKRYNWYRYSSEKDSVIFFLILTDVSFIGSHTCSKVYMSTEMPTYIFRLKKRNFFYFPLNTCTCLNIYYSCVSSWNYLTFEYLLVYNLFHQIITQWKRVLFDHSDWILRVHIQNTFYEKYNSEQTGTKLRTNIYTSILISLYIIDFTLQYWSWNISLILHSSTDRSLHFWLYWTFSILLILHYNIDLSLYY